MKTMSTTFLFRLLKTDYYRLTRYVYGTYTIYIEVHIIHDYMI